MKKSFWVVAMVLAFICIGAIVLQAGGPNVPADLKINSDAKLFKNATKKKAPPEFNLVSLSHKKHGDQHGCKACHHELKSDEPAEQAKAKKCSSEGCHSAEAKEKRLDLENAMHQQCYKDCHKNDEKAKAAKAPVTCSGCHVKAAK